MTHLLVIMDSKGEEIARVPVAAGYTIREVPLPKEKAKPDAAPSKHVEAGDSGKGESKIGP
jgi:hypothetical protein